MLSNETGTIILCSHTNNRMILLRNIKTWNNPFTKTLC